MDDETDDGMDGWKGQPPKDIIYKDECFILLRNSCKFMKLSV
jgi:hypothetical protein